MNKRSETIKLEFPIQLADKLLEEVTMRRPTMSDLRKYRIKTTDDLEGEMKQLSALCSLRLEELDMMDAADYARLQDMYVRFRTPSGQRDDKSGDSGFGQADSLESVGDFSA